MLRAIYTFFVGLFLAIFVGMGIAVFYESPAMPEAPNWYLTPEEKTLTETEKQQERAYIAQQKVYDKEFSHYNRNVSMIVLVCAVAILALALSLASKLGVIADGLLLGGVFTLLYGIGRGMATDSNKYRFLVASISLALTVVLGYLKFKKPAKKSASSLSS